MFRNIKVKSLGKEYRKLNHQNSQCLRLIGQLLLLQLLPGDWMICNLAWKSCSESNYTTKMSISTWNLKFWNPTYRNHRSLQKPVESPVFQGSLLQENLGIRTTKNTPWNGPQHLKLGLQFMAVGRLLVPRSPSSGRIVSNPTQFRINMDWDLRYWQT